MQFYGRPVKRIAATASLAATTGELSKPNIQFTWQLDTTRSGVLLVEEPATELPPDRIMKVTAAARQALAAGRSKVAPDQDMINLLLEEKFKNPMLGIYAGHLLAMQDPVDLDLLRKVVDGVSRLVGDHPDVTALLIPLKDSRAEKLLYSEPPMLRRSWSIIVNASTPEKDLRSPRSYAARIGASLYGSGAWLAWRKPAELEAPRRAVSGSFATAVLCQVGAGVQDYIESGKNASLTPEESAVARYLAATVSQLRQAQKWTAEDDSKSSLSLFYPLVRSFVDSDLLHDTKQALSPAQMTKMTGLPYLTILDAATSLATKLGVAKGASLASQVLGALKFK